MKNEKNTETINTILAFLKKNYIMFIIAIGCIAVMLYAGYTLQEKGDIESENKNQEQVTDNVFIEEQQKLLKQILESVDGVGKCEVMLTLESGTEYIYAQEEKANNYGVDNTYKTVTDGKNETPVVIKKLSPQIAGVAIVCEGGGSNNIKSTVTDIVSKVLCIDSAKISISKRK